MQNCKYYTKYISFGLICTDEQKPWCLHHYETLSIERVKALKFAVIYKQNINNTLTTWWIFS
jgi:hypothetical protein